MSGVETTTAPVRETGHLNAARNAAAWLVGLTAVASAINYASSLVFSRVLSPASFGDLTALLALTVIVTVPTGAAQTVIAARIAALRHSGDNAGIGWFIRHATAHVATISLVIGLLYAACIPLIVPLLDLQAVGPAIALVPLLVLSFFTPAALGLLQGFERFVALGVMLLVITLSRLAVGVPWAMAPAGGAGGALAGQAVGNAAALLLVFWLLRPYVMRRGTGAATTGFRRRPSRSALEASGAFIAFAVLSNLDVLLAKAFLPAAESGRYAAIATVEKIILFLPGAVAVAMVPAAARARMAQGSGLGILRLSAIAVLGMALLAAIPAAVAPSLTLRLMFGAEYEDAASAVLPIVIAGAALALTYLIVVYAVATRERRVTTIIAAGVAAQVAAIALFHDSVAAVATAQAVVTVAVLVVNELVGQPLVRGPRTPLREPLARWIGDRGVPRPDRATTWPGRPRLPRPGLAATGVLLAVAAVVYLPYILHSGFIHDDWTIAQTYQVNGGLLDGLRTGLDTAGRHPGSGLYTGAVHELFGLHQHLHLVWLALLGVATSLVFFGILRRAGVDDVLALAAAALALIFPASSAGRLWVAGGGAEFAVLILLLGVYVALGALRVPGRRGLVRHVPATALYVASVLTYDVAAVVVLGIVLVYRLRTGWARALSRWAIDLAALAVAVVYVRGGSEKSIDTSGGGIADKLDTVAREVAQLLASIGGSVGPVAGPVRVAWPLAALLLLAGAVVLVLGLVRGRADARIRVAALTGVYGLLLVAAGTAVLVVVEGYSPLSVGIYNRVNVLSGFGYVLATIGTLLTLALVVGGRRIDARAYVAVVAIAAVGVGGLYALRTRSHEHAYVESARAQARALDALERVPRPPDGTVVYAAGIPGEAGPGVPVFQATWDLTGALQIAWATDRVQAVPSGTLTGLRCLPDGVQPEGPLYGPRSRTAYADALFADARDGRTARATSVASCRRIAAAMELPLRR